MQLRSIGRPCGSRASAIAAGALLAVTSLLCQPPAPADAISAAAVGLALSPEPGTPDASPRTQISFLGLPPTKISHVNVRGSRSGAHAGRLAAYSDGEGESFLPNRGFVAGERVTVSARVSAGRASFPISWSFAIGTPVSLAPPGPPARAKGAVAPNASRAVTARATDAVAARTGRASTATAQTWRSRPDLRPPALTVTATSPREAPGEIFLSPHGGSGAQHGPMIVDGAGRLVYFHPVHAAVTDFKVQAYDGKPVLTWWEGDVSSLGIGFGRHRLLNTGYRTIATVSAGNGYQADLHDFRITARNTALVTAFAPVRVNLARYGGERSATLLDSVAQEIDVKTGLVMFEWHAFGHVPLSDSYVRAPRAARPYDYFHLNSVQLQSDGNLLLSARNTCAAYEVSALTGGIVWRLAGRRSTFTLGRGVRFYWQHDIRRQPDGTISVFDDGATPKEESQSRGLVIALDTKRRTATLVHQYTHPTPLLAFSQGSMQPLTGGNVFVGWGQVNDISEFSSSGQLLFDARLASGGSYRAFREPWSAQPLSAPSLAVTAAGHGRVSAYASWNGATDVARWQLLAGATADTTAMTAAASAPSAGFETALTAAVGSARYAAVRPLNAAGQALATSYAVKLP